MKAKTLYGNVTGGNKELGCHSALLGQIFSPCRSLLWQTGVRQGRANPAQTQRQRGTHGGRVKIFSFVSMLKNAY